MAELPEPLVLKVMRLRRPHTMPPDASIEAVDVPKLLLPMSLTQSLVGEHFTGYLNLSNISAIAVKDVGLKVELQIGNTSKYMLFNSAVSPVASLEAGDFFDAVV
ncbi:unnamed protein product, partial [Polarella glacialis]